jgi:CRISPR-associated protein Cas2
VSGLSPGRQSGVQDALFALLVPTSAGMGRGQPRHGPAPVVSHLQPAAEIWLLPAAASGLSCAGYAFVRGRGNLVRRTYLVSYDISDPKRLRKVYERMLGFGDPVQLSVFICDLSDSEMVLLREAILEIINQRDDLVMIVDLGVSGSHRSCIEFMGKPVELGERRTLIV